MTINRLVLLLIGAVVMVAALVAGAASPSPAQAYGCTSVTNKPQVIYTCEDPEYRGRPCFNTENNMYSAVCVGAPEVDPDNICITRQVCVTGVWSNVNYLVEEADEEAGVAVDLVMGVAGIVLDVAGGAVDDVNDVLDEGVCVAPFDPSTPICVKG